MSEKVPRRARREPFSVFGRSRTPITYRNRIGDHQHSRAAADHTNSRLRKPERKHVSWTMLLRFTDSPIQLFAGSGIGYRTQPYSDRKPVELTTRISIRANQTFEEQ
jgi:hypothetical protein